MGYDCTLHVLDEDAIRDRFVPRLLNESADDSAFDQRDDADELWVAVRDSLAKLEQGDETPHAATNLISQVAIAYVAAELPYHYERGFCLSMWDELETASMLATFPKKYRANPEKMFAGLIDRYPVLKGKFPTDIESNYCPGVFISADKVPGALKWVERKVKSFAKPDQRLFRGLLLVLCEAVRLGKAYWEGTDLPVPMATIHPPESERAPGLEEWVNPDDIYMEFLYQDGPTMVFAHGIGFPQDCRTVHVDIREWPPRIATTWNEYAISACKSASGRWVTASMTSDQEYMYRARVRDSIDSEPSVLIPLEERKNGLKWAAFLQEQVVAVLGSQVEYGDNSEERLLPAYPLIETAGHLEAVDGLQESPEKFPNVDTVQLRDRSTVFVWNFVGYEFINGMFTATFNVPGRWSWKNRCALAPCGHDGIYCYDCYDRDDGGLFSVRRGQEPVRHLPKVNRIQGITPGPGDSLLVHELDQRGDLGKLYFPDDQTYIRIEPEVFADEDPSEILSLHFVEECDRLIAATAKRLWAMPMEHVLSLPRYNAATGRKRRK